MFDDRTSAKKLRKNTHELPRGEYPWFIFFFNHGVLDVFGSTWHVIVGSDAPLTKLDAHPTIHPYHLPQDDTPQVPIGIR